MAWSDSHLHEFRLGDRRIGMPYREELDDSDGMEDERKVRLAKVDLQAGEKFKYVYYFGDGWATRSSSRRWSRLTRRRHGYPVSIAGARACPPEDSGGPPGYFKFLRKIERFQDEEHDDMLGWIGGVFDPEGFDINRTNAALRRER